MEIHVCYAVMQLQGNARQGTHARDGVSSDPTISTQVAPEALAGPVGHVSVPLRTGIRAWLSRQQSLRSYGVGPCPRCRRGALASGRHKMPHSARMSPKASAKGSRGDGDDLRSKFSHFRGNARPPLLW